MPFFPHVTITDLGQVRGENDAAAIDGRLLHCHRERPGEFEIATGRLLEGQWPTRCRLAEHDLVRAIHDQPLVVQGGDTFEEGNARYVIHALGPVKKHLIIGRALPAPHFFRVGHHARHGQVGDLGHRPAGRALADPHMEFGANDVRVAQRRVVLAKTVGLPLVIDQRVADAVGRAPAGDVARELAGVDHLVTAADVGVGIEDSPPHVDNDRGVDLRRAFHVFPAVPDAAVLALGADVGVHGVDEPAEGLVDLDFLFLGPGVHTVFVGADVKIGRIENGYHLVQNLPHALDRAGIGHVQIAGAAGPGQFRPEERETGGVAGHVDLGRDSDAHRGGPVLKRPQLFLRVETVL